MGLIHIELFATLEALRYQSVITPVPSSYLGLGHMGLGASYRFLDHSDVNLGLSGRVVLPTAIAGIGTGVTLAIARVIGETARQ